MDAMTIIYLGELIGNISGLAQAIVGLSIIAFIASGFFCIMEYDGDNFSPVKKVMSYAKWPLIFAIPMLLLLPSKTTFYMMAAAKVGQDIATSQPAKEIGNKLLKILNEKIDEELNNITSKRDKK